MSTLWNGPADLVPPGRSPLVGDVAEFDEARGLGVVEFGPGRRLPFHATAITDGSRSIQAGTVVAFVVSAGRLGRLEACSVRPLPGVVPPGSTLADEQESPGDRSAQAAYRTVGPEPISPDAVPVFARTAWGDQVEGGPSSVPEPMSPASGPASDAAWSGRSDSAGSPHFEAAPAVEPESARPGPVGGPLVEPAPEASPSVVEPTPALGTPPVTSVPEVPSTGIDPWASLASSGPGPSASSVDEGSPTRISGRRWLDHRAALLPPGAPR